MTHNARVARPAALFDLDRTLVACNTGAVLTRALREEKVISRAFALRAAAWLLRYRLGRLDLDEVAALVASRMQGRTDADFRAYCLGLCERVIFAQLTRGGHEAVARHRARGDLLAVLSSSPLQMVLPLAERLGIPVVSCTELALQGGRFTGQLAGSVCWGREKVARAEVLARTHDLDLAASAFYSDSITDLPLLERVGRPVAVNPDARLERVARARGWPIERWQP